MNRGEPPDAARIAFPRPVTTAARSREGLTEMLLPTAGA